MPTERQFNSKTKRQFVSCQHVLCGESDIDRTSNNVCYSFAYLFQLTHCVTVSTLNDSDITCVQYIVLQCYCVTVSTLNDSDITYVQYIVLQCYCGTVSTLNDSDITCVQYIVLQCYCGTVSTLNDSDIVK